MRNAVQRIFVGACLCLMVVPSVLMPFAHDGATSEKRELAPPPKMMVDGGPNLNVLSDAGDFFADHFAFRPQLVDLDATIKETLFATSSTNNVVVGSDGWLYYAGSLNDYQRRSALSDQALRNAAYNLSLMQDHFTSQGKQFLLAIAPNKNSLYPEHMPYYELAGSGPSNYERLVPLLDERGVNYINLHEVFEAAGEELYFRRDSHWNERGALLAYDSMARRLGRRPMAFDGTSMEQDYHQGDVDGMLHPVFPSQEAQDHLTALDHFEMTNEATDVEDGYIITRSNEGEAQGTLIMYRDSFGNNLLPPFATTYGQAVFTKLVPYDMGAEMTAFAQDVVIERAERHLAFFATDPPYMPAPERKVQVEEEREPDGSSSIYAEENGPYLVVEGTLDESSADKDLLPYVQVTLANGQERTFAAFRVSEEQESSKDFEGDVAAGGLHVVGDRGYRAFLPMRMDDLRAGSSIRVLAGKDDGASVVTSLLVS